MDTGNEETLTVTLSGEWASYLQSMARLFNVTAGEIVERFIASALGRRSAMQTAFPNEPGRAAMIEFITQDGRLFPETPDQLFATVRALTLSQLDTTPDDALILNPQGIEGNA